VTTGKLHDDEVEIDQALVRRLIDGQLPHLGDLEIRAMPSTGTVNAIFRLGDDLCVRLPRVARWAGDLDTELQWLPVLAPRLPLAVPQPVAVGAPAQGYPFRWAVYRWIDGDTYDTGGVADERAAAADLAAFVSDLRRIDAAGAPPSGRLPLRQLDESTRSAIGLCAADEIDADAAMASWQRSLEVPAFDGVAVWRHCDLLAPNILVQHGRLHAVIDFGGVGVGDPAADLIAAWAVFGPAGRARFRQLLDPDDDTWDRGRAYALHQALWIVPYYRETNPAFAALARRTVEQVLADGGG